MIYLKKFDSHASYDTEINGGGVDISLPNVSYCKDVKDIHYTPYNLVRFYVGEITPPQTVQIYTDETNSIPIQVSKGNKWYTYLLPKDKGLYKINGSAVKKVVVKADILIGNGDTIIPSSTVEASFKGSNTSNVTDMNSMFQFCNGLTSLDVSSFDTNNVTDMSYMFNGCSCLTSLDVSNFNTNNVTNMGYMFSGCTSLNSLVLSGWNTSKVTDMASMFEGCNSLISLDVSSFDTSNVTDMSYMFFDCSNLTSLDLSNFNTSKVTNMYRMFMNCSNLTSLDLSKFDTSNVTDMDSMFSGCSNSLSIRMKGCNQTTIDKISAVMPSGAHISTE